MNGSRKRDEAVERLLRESLPRSGGAPSACLDAETVAAWLDGGLSGPALDMAQSHVADCARCQAMVGALATIDSHAPQVRPERGVRPWLNWLVPLTAAAAVVAIYIAVPHNTPTPLAPSSNVLLPAAPAPSQDATPLSERDQAKLPAADEKKQLDSLRAKKADANDSRSAVAAPELRKDAARLEPEAPKPMAPPSTGQARAREESSNRTSAGVIAAPSAPAPSAALADKPAELSRANERAAQSVASEFAAPRSPVRWRIAGSGLQRSTNGGLLWEDVSTGVTTPLTALAAPSATVCWVAGRTGVVLLSTDGKTWRRLPFPETADLMAIQATDARSASVSTADARTFDTTDGGVTWVLRRPLQEF